VSGNTGDIGEEVSLAAAREAFQQGIVVFHKPYDYLLTQIRFINAAGQYAAVGYKRSTDHSLERPTDEVSDSWQNAPQKLSPSLLIVRRLNTQRK